MQDEAKVFALRADFVEMIHKTRETIELLHGLESEEKQLIFPRGVLCCCDCEDLDGFEVV